MNYPIDAVAVDNGGALAGADNGQTTGGVQVAGQRGVFTGTGNGEGKVPRGRPIISAPLPAAQSPPVVSLSVLALIIASRSEHLPSPATRLSLVSLTDKLAAATV